MSRPTGSCTNCPLLPQCDLLEECLIRETYQHTVHLERNLASMCNDLTEIKGYFANGTLTDLVEAANIIKHIWERMNDTWGIFCAFGRLLRTWAIGLAALAAASAIIWRLAEAIR